MRAKFPDWGVGDVAKELGKRWELCSNRTKYEQMAAKDKARYEKVIVRYIYSSYCCLVNKDVFLHCISIGVLRSTGNR